MHTYGCNYCTKRDEGRVFVGSSSVRQSTAGRRGGKMATDAEAVKARAKSVIGAETRCVTRDGRVFVGTLRCVDKQKNVILSNAREYASENESEARRTINMVLLSEVERRRCEFDEGSVVVGALEGLSVT